MEAGKFYDQYTVEDFILDERFHEWVMQGKDDELWQKVLRDYPEKSEAIRSARTFILRLKISEDLPGKEREQAAVQRFRELVGQRDTGRADSMAATNSRGTTDLTGSTDRGVTGPIGAAGLTTATDSTATPDPSADDLRLRKRMIPEKGAPARGGAGQKWLTRVAASLLILGLLGGGSWTLFKKRPVLVETAYGQMKQVKLPDNSIIYLNANSNLRYVKSVLGDFSREVWLEGEAFFEVEKARSESGGYRNFVVHTQGMAVEVLGTSFNVRDRHSSSSVTLQTGKVQVNTEKGRKVMLEPGERLEINRKDNRVVKNKVNPERYTSWKNLRYTFDQTPVSELVQIINDNYGLEVVITDKKIAGSNLSGVLEADNLQTFVNALSFALNITIRKQGNQLIFEPKEK